MLSEADKKWLEERDKNELAHGLYSCIHCGQFSHERDEFSGHCAGELKDCPLFNGFRNYLDAAEFEARVIAKLAELSVDVLPCFPDHLCPFSKKLIGSCNACYIRLARLAVEEEIDK